MTKESNSVSNKTWREASKGMNILAYVPLAPLSSDSEEMSSQNSGADTLTRGDLHNVLETAGRKTSILGEGQSEK